MKQSAAHVRGGFSRARGGIVPSGVMVMLDREGRELVQPFVHSEQAHDVITAELVACTLGQRVRPELRLEPELVG